MKRRFTFLIGCIPALCLLSAALACARVSEQVIVYITATPRGNGGAPGATSPVTLVNLFAPTITPNSPTPTLIRPTPNPLQDAVSYTVQTGDTLGTIAIVYGVAVDDLIKLNPTLTPDTPLAPGQVLALPNRTANGNTTPDFKIIPDSELVDSPSAVGFDVDQFVRFQPGFLRVYSETIGNRLMSGVDIVNFLAISNSVNPRILLTALEYSGGWLTNPVPAQNQIDYPLGYVNKDFQGLFRQLSWAASTLNEGYYGWKYRGLSLLKFDSGGAALAFAPGLNAGTVAVQYLLSRTTDKATWLSQVGANGFFATYVGLFGDPFRYTIDPLIPANLTQPALQLPFPQKQTWYYTGGPHGGWDAASGWAGIDFAPPAPPDALLAAQGPCYVSPFTETSMAAGLVVRSGDGAVVINLDMQNDERVGWTLLYLHVADQDRVPAQTVVQTGTPIGHPSCQGFDLNAAATHLHIARRYNGEWLPADCWACAPGTPAPPFVLSGWRVRGIPAQIYQGSLEKSGQPTVKADQGRNVTDNEISW
jgi:LasA protease